MRLIIIGVVFSFLFVACADKTVEPKSVKPYFDLTAAINDEARRLGKANLTINKTVTKDGNRESITTDSINWDRELTAFLEYDINKPAWKDSYKIDTIESDLDWLITYTSLYEDLPVKELAFEVNKETEACKSIKGKRVFQNYIYSSTQEVNYEFDIAYTIEGRLEVNFIFSTDYSISGNF